MARLSDVLYNPMHGQKHSIVNQGRLYSTIFNQDDSALLFNAHPPLHIFGRNLRIARHTIQGEQFMHALRTS